MWWRRPGIRSKKWALKPSDHTADPLLGIGTDLFSKPALFRRSERVPHFGTVYALHPLNVSSQGPQNEVLRQRLFSPGEKEGTVIEAEAVDMAARKFLERFTHPADSVWWQRCTWDLLTNSYALRGARA